MSPLDDRNWDDSLTESDNLGFQEGPESQIGGVVDMEDDVYLEFDAEEEEVVAPPPEPNTWRLLARYRANFCPNANSMFTLYTDGGRSQAAAHRHKILGEGQELLYGHLILAGRL
jgi:hypothetical protein